MTTARLSAFTVSADEVVLAADRGSDQLTPTASEVVTSRDLDAGRRGRLWLTVVPLLTGALATVLLGVHRGVSPLPLVAVLTWWLVALPGARHGFARLGGSDVEPIVRRTISTFAGMSLCVVLAGGSTSALLEVALLLATATGVLIVTVRVLAWRAPIRVLLVGEAATLARPLSRWQSQGGATVVGVVRLGDGDEPGPVRRSCLPQAEDLTAIPGLIRRWRVDCVVLVPGPALGPVEVASVSWATERSRVRLLVYSSVVDAVGAARLGVGRHGQLSSLHIGSSRVPPAVAVAKQAIDRVGALLALVLVWPLLVLLGIVVRLDSPGPALFRQTRIGRHGRPFTMLKLRTMGLRAEDQRASLGAADQGNAVLFKIHDDPRVTRVGRLLRQFSLDELPQLVNVVLGQMSLVGPRPALPSEVACYDHVARRRLAVKPGITGLWQVRGRSDLDWEQSVALDVEYADNVSLGGDLRICLATVRATLGRRGAY